MGKLDECIHLGCEVGGEAPGFPWHPHAEKAHVVQGIERFAAKRALAFRAGCGAVEEVRDAFDARKDRGPRCSGLSVRSSHGIGAAALVKSAAFESGGESLPPCQQLRRHGLQCVRIASGRKMPRLGAFKQRRQARADAFAGPFERVADGRGVDQGLRLRDVRETVVVVRRAVEAVEAQDFFLRAVHFAEHMHRRALFLTDMAVLHGEAKPAHMQHVERLPLRWLPSESFAFFHVASSHTLPARRIRLPKSKCRETTMTVSTYLTFDGNCREAFEFYRDVFGGEFEMLSTFGESPDEMSVPEELKEAVMHVSLPIGNGVLMGSDNAPEAPPLAVGNNFSLSVEAESRDHADQLLARLSAGGAVTMPMDVTFWGAYFGMCSDRFGINWMVVHELAGNSGA